ncbi:16S rRNA (cytosine(967)-C(5))-methyltransferase RsmB [Metabacillus fastidiosus]|uniref:16S rRNA (cytosine(967)-C(5))-methyltransferase n=1 Tax=Metabacillus fastidiosus TaxID=1458 RepID=A0ABU6NWY0_9BACI|nr:16S rRNA (cytosine(967)-C(5))-methyltransferase RsmB [Metabacillus fastidiosus]MED4452832.1 16S rRNA (cytosine(967)-C(5))-methyltransferase RsmB [Metabacillus fastidiosus]
MKKNNVRDVALEALLQVEKNQAYSNLLLNAFIKKHAVDKKDIPLFTELVYGTLQRRDTLDFFLEPFLKNSKKLEDWVRILLRLSVYQMIYLDRIPERAIFFEAVEIAKKRGHKGTASLVNGVLRSLQREGVPSVEEIEDDIERIAVKTSHPKWLIEKWVKQFGLAETEKTGETNLLPPVQTARVNKMKETSDSLIEKLNEEGFSVEHGDLSEDAVKSVKGNLVHTQAFKEGLFTIQDESSMLVARALGVEENDNILDACAAPGGKSTHIAELLNGTGHVHSLDIHEHKVKLINEQAERLELGNIQTYALDSRKADEQFEKESFDKVLVDAPCSGLGVVRRKPDLKYTKQQADVEKLAKLQYTILETVASLLKKEGRLIYSTCTVDHEENADVVAKFLENHPEFEKDETVASRLPERVKPFIKDGELQILPHYFGTDGFYIAALRKKG